MLSQVLKPGTTRQDRQQILELIDNYSRYDPAEVAQFYDQLFDSILLLFPGMPRRAGGPKQKPTVLSPGAATSAAEQAAADKAAWDNMNWDERGRYFEDRAGRTLHRNFPVIDKIPDGLAASIKSMDFRAATYQKATPFAYRLKIYVRRPRAVPDLADRERHARRLWPALVGPGAGWNRKLADSRSSALTLGTNPPGCFSSALHAPSPAGSRACINHILVCRLARKLDFLALVFFPIAFGMLAMALNLINAILLRDAPGDQ
jgi:hypothetical protein